MRRVRPADENVVGHHGIAWCRPTPIPYRARCSSWSRTRVEFRPELAGDRDRQKRGAGSARPALIGLLSNAAASSIAIIWLAMALRRAAIPRSARRGKQGGRGASLDDLIGAGEKGLRHCEAEFLGGLQVDDQFEICRLLNRQVGRLLTL